MRNDKQRVEYMCKAMEDRINDEKLRIAINLLLIGSVSKENIAKATELPIEKIEELAAQLSSVNS